MLIKYYNNVDILILEISYKNVYWMYIYLIIIKLLLLLLLEQMF